MTTLVGRYLRIIKQKKSPLRVNRRMVGPHNPKVHAHNCTKTVGRWTDLKTLRGSIRVALRLEIVEQELEAYPAEPWQRPDFEPTPELPAKRARTRNAALEQNSVCNCCGEKGHWQYRCPGKEKRCQNCWKVGHLTKMCRATRLTDKTGKMRALVENRPGRVALTAPQDRTKEQYSHTAAEILKMFQTHFAKTAKGRKKSRKRKRGQSGGSREDAQLPAEPEEKSGRASDDDDVIEDIGAFLSKAEQPAEDISPSSTISGKVLNTS